MSLSAICDVDITPGDTLIVFDEIQDQPKALESLKFFCEDAPEYHIIVAGSLLGLSLHEGISYPVGKVEEMRLFPMSFPEFLRALGKDRLADYLITQNWDVIKLLHSQFVDLLRQYYYVSNFGRL